MKQVFGVDCLRGLVGDPPKEITISYDDLKQAQLAISAMNPCFIGMVPYCFKCKVPLDWITEAPDDERIFVCSDCGRVWKKGEGWKNSKGKS